MLPRIGEEERISPHISRTTHSLRVAPMVSVSFVNSFYVPTVLNFMSLVGGLIGGGVELRSNVTLALDPPLLRLHLVVHISVL